MPSAQGHHLLTTTQLHVPGYRQSSDPGAVGADIYWVDTSGGSGNWSLKVRNAANTGWEVVSPASGFVNPMTTQDDIIVGGVSGASTRLAKGTDGQVLTVDPTTHHLVWSTPTAVGHDHTSPSDGGILTNGSNAIARLPRGTAGQALVYRGGTPVPTPEDQVSTLNFVIDGGGSVITTGVKGDLVVDFGCVITGVTLLADQSGSVVVDIWKDTYANYPPLVGDSITASAKPTISSATKAQDTTLTSWTTTVAAGDTLRFNVDSVTTLTRVTVAIKVRRN
jgi:hypothetical protein